jgi:hypothetical protein
MTPPIVLTRLADKRSRLLAEMEYFERRVASAADAIAKIDAVIDLFEERSQLVYVRRSYQPHAKEIPWGRTGKAVMRLLYAAPEGLTTAEIQLRIARDKDWLNDSAVLRLLSRRVNAALYGNWQRGLLVKDGERNNRIVFRIAREGESVIDPTMTLRFKRLNEAAARRMRELRRARKMSGG